MGAIGFTGFNILFYISAHSTTAINIGILQGALPVFVLLGTFFIFRETILPIQLVGITITILGVVIVATEGDINHLRSLQFNKGDVLVMLSDGLPEAENDAGELYDYERVVDVINKNASKSADELKSKLIGEVDIWLKGGIPDDDVTIVVVKKI